MLMDYLYKNISSLKKIIFVSHQMPPQAVSHALEFIYTGRLNKRAGLHLTSLDQVSFSSFLHLPSLDQDFLIFLLNLFSHLFLHHASLNQVFSHIRWFYSHSQLLQVAKLLELPILVEYLNNLRNKEEFLNADLTTKV